MKFLKSLLINAGIAVCSLVVFLLVAEMVARIVLPEQRVKRSPQVRHLPSDTLGWVIEPNQQTYTFSFPVTINAEGWRGRAFPLQKPAGVTRILCLGDSLTFGAGVRTEDTYPAQLERLLNQGRPVQKFEVLNMGVFGYGTRQEIDVLQTTGVNYQPDLVVIGFYANDPEDTLRYYGYHQTLPPAAAQAPQILPEPAPAAKEPAVNSQGARISGVRQWFQQFIGTHLAGKRLLPPQVMYVLQNSRFAYYCGWLINRLVISASMEPDLLMGRNSPKIQEAWQKVDECFQEAAALSQQSHFKLVLLIFPHSQQLSQDYPQAQYQTVVVELARKYNLPYLDLRPAFQQAYTTFESLFIPYDGHPNEKAYQITAAALYRFLQVAP